MQQSSNTILDLNGNALAGVAVRVFAEDGALAELFSDNNGTPVGNPVYTDPNGRYWFYAVNGRYTTQIEPPNGAEYPGEDLILFDPKDTDISVGVKDFGAVGDGVADDSAAFQAAVDALPPLGGRVLVAGSNFKVNTAPVVGTKSIYWDFAPGVAIQGTQTTFPRFATNADCTVNGPYIRAQRANPTIDGAASFAMGIESVQPASDTNNGHGALYLGAQLNASGLYSITSALNAVATALAGSSGNVFCIEADVASFAGPGVGTQFGILVSGYGGNDITFGIRINRHDGGTSKYLYGIAIAHARIGLFVDDKNASLENGLVLGDPPARYGNQMVQAMQISDGGNVLLLQRRTNTSPTGNFFSCINADNTAQLSALDVLGNFFAQRVQGAHFRAVGNPSAPPAGQVAFGAQTSTTASAGSITPPAQLVKYLVFYEGATQYRIPLYAA